MTKDDWEYGSAKPDTPGWYPILVCWDPVEGIFPFASRWTGSEWEAYSHRPIVAYWPQVFTTEQAAEACAYEHDPNL